MSTEKRTYSPLRIVAVVALLVVAFIVGYVRGGAGDAGQDAGGTEVAQSTTDPAAGQETDATADPATGQTADPATGQVTNTAAASAAGQEAGTGSGTLEHPDSGEDPASAVSADFGLDQGTGSASLADDVYELVFYPAQTDVDPDDVYVYGEPVGVPSSVRVKRGGEYTSMEEVALYIHTYGTVPGNFVTKTRARDAGWVASEGNLWDVLPGRSIGGGGWHNDEWTMPGASYDQWYECDIGYEGGYRGAERLVYSDNGMIFYTPDHYSSYARIF